MAFTTTIFFNCVLVLSISSLAWPLSFNYYDKTCPNAESIVTQAMKDAIKNDKTAPAAILRMHFHDCFVRAIRAPDKHKKSVFVLGTSDAQGCDASVLLSSKGNNKAEKDGPPNVSLHAFYVIDNAKKALEAACPGVVSCADILAFAARDAVALSGGPTWNVPKGRLDGRTSLASETIQLPAPTFKISQLQQIFSQRGLSMSDLVALSGGHTLGFAHCSSFQNRIQNFNATLDLDPSLNPSFAASLKSVCPKSGRSKNAGATMDPSATTFDNTYYKLILQGKALFSSDQSLLTTPKTKSLVTQYATSKAAFYKAFAQSMIKMSSLTGGQEVRKNCRVVN